MRGRSSESESPKFLPRICPSTITLSDVVHSMHLSSSLTHRYFTSRHELLRSFSHLNPNSSSAPYGKATSLRCMLPTQGSVHWPTAVPELCENRVQMYLCETTEKVWAKRTPWHDLRSCKRAITEPEQRKQHSQTIYRISSSACRSELPKFSYLSAIVILFVACDMETRLHTERRVRVP
jgi:hypothetical protein